MQNASIQEERDENSDWMKIKENCLKHGLNIGFIHQYKLHQEQHKPFEQHSNTTHSGAGLTF